MNTAFVGLASRMPGTSSTRFSPGTRTRNPALSSAATKSGSDCCDAMLRSPSEGSYRWAGAGRPLSTKLFRWCDKAPPQGVALGEVAFAMRPAGMRQRNPRASVGQREIARRRLSSRRSRLALACKSRPRRSRRCCPPSKRTRARRSSPAPTPFRRCRHLSPGRCSSRAGRRSWRWRDALAPDRRAR